MLWHDLEIEATSEPGQGLLEWFSKVKLSYQLNEGILAHEGFHQKKAEKKYFFIGETGWATIKMKILFFFTCR